MVYNLGETVPIGNDFFDNALEAMNGYEVTVKSAQIFEYENYVEQELNVNLQELPDGQDKENPPDKVYVVTLSICNIDNNTTGINFEGYRITNNNIIADLNYSLYETANPTTEGSLKISLREDTEMDFYLPFNLREEHYVERNWDNLDSIPFKLVVTLYPTKKMINII